MHEHDQEIIMALAEGSLPTEAAAAAEAQIAACADCLRDLELQRLALSTLGEAPAVYLTATESARLHDRLHRELAVATPAPARSRPERAWGRWAGFAFGTAAVFLAAFLVLPALFGGSDDDAASEFSEAAADLNDVGAASETTSAAAEAAPPAREQAAGGDGADDQMLALESDAAATTTAAPETIAAPESTGDPTLDWANYLAYFVEGDLTTDLRDEVIGRLESDGEAFLVSDEAAIRIEPQWSACLESESVLEAMPAGAEAQIIGIVADATGADAGMERLLVVFVTTDPKDSVLVSITLPQCEVFETLP